jgi:hypothetical protein
MYGFLVFLIPFAIVVAWAAIHDLKRRRRQAPSVDVASRVRAVRASAEPCIPSPVTAVRGS